MVTKNRTDGGEAPLILKKASKQPRMTYLISRNLHNPTVYTVHVYVSNKVATAYARQHSGRSPLQDIHRLGMASIRSWVPVKR